MSTPTTPPTPRPRRRRLAISVRVMMALVLVIGLPMGWKARRAGLQRRAIAAVLNEGGRVRFDYEEQRQKQSGLMIVPKPWGPRWLHRAIGEEYFREITAIWCNGGRVPDPMPRISDALMAAISDCGELKSLSLAKVSLVNSDVLKLAKLSRLEKLELWSVDLDDEGLGSIGKLARMKELMIHKSPDAKSRISGSGLARLGGLTGLVNLRIEGAELDRPKDLAPMAGMPGLEILALDRSPRDESCLDYLAELTRLERLELRGTEVGYRGIRALSALDRLDFVAFAGSRMTDSDLAGLARHEALEYVEIPRLVRATDAGVAHLLRLPRLRTVSLREAAITGACLENLPRTLRLFTLDLSHSAISDVGLAHLPDGPDFLTLSLAGTKLTDAGLNQLGRSKLYSLDLSGMNLTDAALDSLTRIEGLGDLNLARTNLTDASLGRLAGITELYELDLTETAITDAGLAHLAGMPRLGRLRLSGSKMTPAGIESFRKLRPNVQLWIDGNTDGPWFY